LRALPSLRSLAVTAAPAATASATTVETALSPGAVFSVAIMACIPHMALPVPRFIRLEMIEGTISTRRQRTSVPAMRIITVIDVAIKASGAAKPGSRSNEYAAVEPVWPVVTVRRAVIRRIIVVPVRTPRFHPYAYRDLASCWTSTGKEYCTE
jgi:hypothetical protein